MIRKFLICDRQPILVSNYPEGHSTPVIELALPLDIFWEAQDQLRRLEYLHSSHGDAVIIGDLIRAIYKLVGRYAVYERDRVKLMALGTGGPSSES